MKRIPGRHVHRPVQTNCCNEPGYPEHRTVVFVMSAPEWTAHSASDRCEQEYPHLIAYCGEFGPRC